MDVRLGVEAVGVLVLCVALCGWMTWMDRARVLSNELRYEAQRLKQAEEHVRQAEAVVREALDVAQYWHAANPSAARRAGRGSPSVHTRPRYTRMLTIETETE
jgi:hypothetical protein